MPRIWLDIETIPPAAKPALEEIQPPANYSKAETIQKFREDKQDEYWRALALESLRGRICSLAWAVDNMPPVCRGIWDCSERDMLAELDQLAGQSVAEGGAILWCGFNHRAFDLNWIWHRAVRENLDNLVELIPRDRYSKNVLDVREKWSGGDSRAKGKLKEIATFLGLETLPDIDGSKVVDLFLAGQFETIAEYNKHDVTLTRDINRLIEGLPPLGRHSFIPKNPTAEAAHAE